MKASGVLLLAVLGVLAPATSIAQVQPWAIKGTFVESCSCKPVCPCNLGLQPAHHPCESNGLLEIESGHYGGVKLDGVSIVLTFRLGDWVKYYVNETATDEQVRAAVALVEQCDLTDGAKALSTQKAKITVERAPSKVTFSAPESAVEIELVKGQDGKPIKIENLPSRCLVDYTQYRSIVTRHRSRDKKFSYSGTNGLVAKVDATSK